MAFPRTRSLAIVVSAALLLGALSAAAVGGSAATKSAPVVAYAGSVDSAPAAVLRPERVARAAISWRGGPITTSTGETVEVQLSDALPAETATPESWAEFLTSLTHGPEISRLTAYFATLDEVRQICGSRALGCYGRDQMFVPGETIGIDTTPEEVVRHEYGHHVAASRLNTPWEAVDYGPKQWASAANVCSRVTKNEAFPGDEGENYTRNPGEAWAEVYRLMDERKAGIATASWQIIVPSFFPDEAALQAAERDVVQPWTAAKTKLFTRVFGKRAKKVWWIPLQTPLDGDLRITATLPNRGKQEVALVAPNRRTVIRRAQWVGQRVKSLTGTVCGQRSLFVRVTPSGAPGRVRVSAATP